MTYAHTYTKEHLEQFWFDESGKPKCRTTTTEFKLDEFTEFFIHYLSDHLPQLDLDENRCSVERLHEFKQLYIDCMLHSLYEYDPDTYHSP